MTQENPKAPFNPFNRPKFAALERLVCSLLIESLDASPIETVSFISRAGMLLSDEELEKLEIDNEKLVSVYTVAERLKTTGGTVNGNGVRFNLSFNDLDFETEVMPWLWGTTFGYFGNGVDSDKLHEMGFETKLRFLSDKFTNSGFRNIRSAFLKYAVPYIQRVGGKLTSLISPDTYSTMLQTYKGSQTQDRQRH